MGYYDEKTLNYYYYMASQFAVSDRWFSPVASKSIDNRIATFSGGTTQGLVQDPGGNDHLPQLDLPVIFRALDAANVSWKIYYTVTTGFCTDEDDCPTGLSAQYPATDFENFTYSFNYLRANPKPGSTTDCPAPMQPSSVVGDTGNTFCIDTDHIAPIAQYYSDLTAGTLPSFAFIEAGYARNDEHPGSGQPILLGQAEVAKVVGALMATSTSTANNYWADSVFFFSYDEGGGPFDHVPPVPGYSNKYTDAMVGDTPVADIPDIGGAGAKDGVPGTGGIAVNPDSYFPCLPLDGVATTHCDLNSDYPGAESTANAPAQYGFAAQLGFRLPNIVISPFTRKHYVSHIPMDHTAVIRFVEDRFIGNHKYLTNRDAAQPNLLDFFDFNNVPWATPPTPPTPNPVLGTCHAASFAP
jgi:phospholipase C